MRTAESRQKANGASRHVLCVILLVSQAHFIWPLPALLRSFQARIVLCKFLVYALLETWNSHQTLDRDTSVVLGGDSESILAVIYAILNTTCLIAKGRLTGHAASCDTQNIHSMYVGGAVDAAQTRAYATALDIADDATPDKREDDRSGVAPTTRNISLTEQRTCVRRA